MNRYFVFPSFPREVWFGNPDAPDKAQLTAFVHSDVDANWVARALNSKAGCAAIEEEDRRDEKRGLYPDKEDCAN